MFSRYTEQAQQAIIFAQDESRRLYYDYVGTEHLLLGLLRQDDSPAVAVLRSVGAEPDQLRTAVEQMIGPGSGPTRGEIGFTPRAKKVMVELAIEEARRLRHNVVGAEHLLLGLASQSDGVAAEVLHNAGADLERLRAAVAQIARTGDSVVMAPGPRPLLALSNYIRNVLFPLASAEAIQLGSPMIEPEHLLLAMLRDAEPTLSNEVMKERGITLEWLRERLTR